MRACVFLEASKPRSGQLRGSFVVFFLAFGLDELADSASDTIVFMAMKWSQWAWMALGGMATIAYYWFATNRSPVRFTLAVIVLLVLWAYILKRPTIDWHSRP